MLSRLSIKDHVLSRALDDARALDGMSDKAFREPADFLKPRLEQDRRGQLSGTSVEDIRH